MKTENQNGVSLKHLAKTMRELAALECQIKKSDVDQSFITEAKKTGAGIFKLIIMGEIKKGKSSFINALIGSKNLVPVHSDVATSTVFKIHYGPKVKYTVYFNHEKDPLEIDSTELNAFGTEDGNPDNTKNVDYIRVQSPAPILKNGLVVIDTPGVGGLFEKHREISYRQVPQADAVFFVTDSVESPIGEAEVKFLKELRQITPAIYFVQTKSSSVDSEARKARMVNNLEILEKNVGLSPKEINYFIVDSKLKMEADQDKDIEDLADSGYPVLMNFLDNSLRKNQDKIIARKSLRCSMLKLNALRGEVNQMKSIVFADTKEKRESLDKEMKAIQDKVQKWDREIRPQLLDSFNKEIQALGRKAKEEMVPIRSGGKIQLEFYALLEKADTKAEVKAMLSGFESDLGALVSKKNFGGWAEFSKSDKRSTCSVKQRCRDYGKFRTLSVFNDI